MQRLINILLVYPPAKTQTHGKCPMGLMMLGAALEKKGRYKIALLDANAEEKRYDNEQILGFSKNFRPDIIGMTLVTPVVKEAYKLARSLRKSGAKLLAGGPHASLRPEEPLRNGFDGVVVGEGESTIDEAAQAMLGLIPKESVAGFGYLGENGKAVINERRPLIQNLDDLPMPARHLVDQNAYRPHNVEMIFSSRGCPSKCSFCSGGLFGKRFRFRSARSVLDEMFYIHRTYGVTNFHFVDDAMTMDRDRFAEICKELTHNGAGFTWSMMTRVDAVDEEILGWARDAGCRRIDYGVESGHPETLRKIHKPHTVEMVKRILPLTAAFGIQPNVFLILGFPWEDVNAIEATLNLMVQISPFVQFHPAIASILIPFPGTEIFEKYKERYGFEDWWLSEDRYFDAPTKKTHPYYETVLFENGAVLDANFFDYSKSVKKKIISVFKFMYRHNMKSHGSVHKFVKLFMLSLSESMSDLAPPLERISFCALLKLMARAARSSRFFPQSHF
jgi:anaerobic magnesium-protoporphyrin IX monomethyl ester cyclase